MLVLAAVTLAIWCYLAFAHGRFWTTAIRLPRNGVPPSWPPVAVVVPARDEAAMLPRSLPSLLAQRYPGDLRVIVVDDASSDGTGELAAGMGAEVVPGGGPPPGWTGKLAAMALGVEKAGEPEFLLFTDADIAYPPDAVAALVGAAGERFDLVSQMVRLRAVGVWERLIIPAFVYFFAQLYPFSQVNSPRRRRAAAAGGCMLVRRSMLLAAGGLERIRGSLIDDVALARLLKSHGARVWLGLSARITSVRPYPDLASLWRMVSRSAYTQLRHSPVLLAGTVLGLLLVYTAPVVATIAGALQQAAPTIVLGGLSWAIMTATYLPMLRFYRVGRWRALTLPLVALAYLGMTLDSARLHVLGRGGQWKGRAAHTRQR